MMPSDHDPDCFPHSLDIMLQVNRIKKGRSVVRKDIQHSKS